MTKRGGLLFLGMRAEAGDQGPCQKVDEEEIHDVGRYYCYDSDWAAAAAALWTYGRLKKIEEDTIECDWPPCMAGL